MRENKFRAWDTDYKFMDDDVYISGEGLVYQPPSIGYDTPYTEIEECGYPVMQCTGIKDKNGVEIYEGDYIRFTDFDSNQGYEGEVAFKGGAFCMLHKIEGAMRNIIMATMLDVDGYIEIIGNIYENKELLEENQND